MERLRLSLITMQECMAMHWENQKAESEGKAIPYGENQFYSIINRNYQ